MVDKLTRRSFLGGMAGSAAFNIMTRSAALETAANSKIEVGVVGLGGRGDMIAQFLQMHGGYKITSLADYFPEVSLAAGERFGVPKTRCFSGLMGYKRLLESGVDAVFLETPPCFFPEHGMAAVEAGCHVYMAKPVACDVPGCLRVREAAQKAKDRGTVFFVDFQIRTNPLIAQGIEKVRNGEIGPIGMLRSLWIDTGYSDPEFTGTIESRLQRLIWVNDNALGGGYHVCAAIHIIDEALWLVGENPASAVGVSRAVRGDPQGDSHDAYAITYEFANGAVLNHFGDHRKTNNFDLRCTAHCRDGYLELGYNGRVLLHQRNGDWGGEVKDLYEGGTKRNIATFHDDILAGNHENTTVEPSVNAALASILGRDAAAKKTRMTWDEMMTANRRLTPNLEGLKM